jgi:hypothetical protein
VHDANAGAPELAPQRLAEADDPRLGRRVRRDGGHVRVADDRGVVDDRARAAREHARQHALGEVHDRDEVDLEHRVDRGGVLLLEQAADELAGVVDEDVGLGEAGAERGDRLVDRLARGEVEGDGADVGRAARRRRQRLEAVRVADAGEEAVQRAGGERLGERAPDAAVGAGDEGGAAGEVHAGGTGGPGGADQ